MTSRTEISVFGTLLSLDGTVKEDGKGKYSTEIRAAKDDREVTLTGRYSGYNTEIEMKHEVDAELKWNREEMLGFLASLNNKGMKTDFVAAVSAF